ncbi:MAG TPA: pitrilysin family protein, partial [Chitinophagaceae bacterium]|nr:pitrilysin family protein [Chitinophagaceae bacterium]
MWKKSILLATCTLVQLAVTAQAKLVEKVKKNTPAEIVIPYEKYVFPNGLTLVVHEDHSDPLVHVDVTYHVGSAREEIGKSGFAHFFEHMMFQGSDHVADEQHFKIITEAGGTLNGTTNRDRTNYFETVPSNQLEKMLWLESDRMGFLLDAVTQKKFEVQRATVKNERGQNYDNRPYGLVQETLSRNLYPYGHPYSWLTIGYIEDLNRVDVQDLKNFFLRWYGPNNAVVTIGGDVKTADVVKLVEKYFGKIPPGPKVEKTVLPPAVITEDRYVNMTDNYAKMPMLVCAIPTVPAHHKDEAALDCLAGILGGDNNSILYQSIVKNQRAISANVSNGTDELAGAMQFQITTKGESALSEMVKEVKSAIMAFESRGVSDDDIQKFRSSQEARIIYGLESVSGKVSQLASFQTFTGNTNYIKTELKRYTEVTKDDVMRVYRQYIKDKAMVILSCLPKGQELLKAGEANYIPSEEGYTPPDYGYGSLKYVKAKDGFDRSKMPAAGSNPVIHLPKFKTIELDGMKLLSARTDELPVVVISIGLRGGRMAEQNNLSKAGVAQLFAAMMDEDTKLHSAEEMSVLLDKLGSSISVGTDIDETGITVRCLKKNLQATLDLLEERLLQPKFTQEAFDRIKNQKLEGIKNARTRAANVAGIAFSKLNYGKYNVLGLPGTGLQSTLENVTLDDVKDYYKNYTSRNGMKVVVVGDVEDKDALDILSRLNLLSNQEIRFTVLPDPIPADPKVVYLVNVPRAAQTEFRIGYVTDLKYDALGEYYKSTLANYAFGGAFNSRINLNLREDKGWTYGARSAFNGNDYTGTFQFSSGIKAAATDSALEVIMKELETYVKEGMKNEELLFMQKALGQSDARKYETGFQKAGFLVNILQYNLKPDFVEQQNKILQSIRIPELNQLIRKWMDPSHMSILLAGDKERITPGLKRLGYTIVELDTDGER